MNDHGRVLAIDIRLLRFGYAVFEIPTKILSFGISTTRVPRQTRDRLMTLIKQFRPSVIVVREMEFGSKRSRYHNTNTMRVIRAEAQTASISIKYISESDSRNFSQHFGK